MCDTSPCGISVYQSEFYYKCNLIRRHLIDLMSGNKPEIMENLDLELTSIADSHMSLVTGIRIDNLKRITRKSATRKPMINYKTANQELIDKFYSYLELNSDIANRDTDSQTINGVIQRNRYYKRPKTSLLTNFGIDNNISASSLSTIIRKNSKFQIFKTSHDRNRDIAVCDKCLKVDLLKNALETSNLDFINVKKLLQLTICESPKLSCYEGICQKCTRDDFVKKVKDLFEDHADLNKDITYSLMSKNGEDIYEATSSIAVFIEDWVGKVYYKVGNSGTGNKLAYHLLRKNESFQYKQWCYDQVQNNDTILFWIDYGMELARLDPAETQLQHFRRKGFPILGGVENLPDGKKYYRYWLGEVEQKKSPKFTVKALKEWIHLVSDLISNHENIRKVLIVSDGAGDFWCSEVMHHYPDIFDGLKCQFPNLEVLLVTKGTSGHGKSEIDSM